MNIYDWLFCFAIVFALFLLFRADPSDMEEHAETLHRGYDKDGNFLGYLTEAGMDLVKECQNEYENIEN